VVGVDGRAPRGAASCPGPELPPFGASSMRHPRPPALDRGSCELQGLGRRHRHEPRPVSRRRRHDGLPVLPTPVQASVLTRAL